MRSMLKSLALLIPPVKRLYGQKQACEQTCRELQARLHAAEASGGVSSAGEWLLIDRENGWVHHYDNGTAAKHAITDLDALYAVAEDYLRITWFNQYYATFTWLGTPLLQYPEDMIRWQELIWRVKPDVIIETGIYKGGSILFTASMCRLIGKGRVVSIDISVPPEVRTMLEDHPLGDLITVFEGSSTDAGIYSAIASSIKPDDVVLVILDSDHTKDHVSAELKLYAPLVSPGSFIVVCDGIMRDLAGRGEAAPAEWRRDNPYEAARQFARNNAGFIWEEPVWNGAFSGHEAVINRYFEHGRLSAPDGYRTRSHTYWPGAYLRRMTTNS